MITYLIYNRRTQGERQMQELAKRLEPHQVRTELMDADTPRGIQLAEHYELFARPAVMVVRDDGSLVQLWDNPEQLPSPTEISYLATP